MSRLAPVAYVLHDVGPHGGRGVPLVFPKLEKIFLDVFGGDAGEQSRKSLLGEEGLLVLYYDGEEKIFQYVDLASAKMLAHGW